MRSLRNHETSNLATAWFDSYPVLKPNRRRFEDVRDQPTERQETRGCITHSHPLVHETFHPSRFRTSTELIKLSPQRFSSLVPRWEVGDADLPEDDHGGWADIG